LDGGLARVELVVFEVFLYDFYLLLQLVVLLKDGDDLEVAQGWVRGFLLRLWISTAVLVGLRGWMSNWLGARWRMAESSDY
jgi:hypothetical protein